MTEYPRSLAELLDIYSSHLDKWGLEEHAKKLRSFIWSLRKEINRRERARDYAWPKGT